METPLPSSLRIWDWCCQIGKGWDDDDDDDDDGSRMMADDDGSRMMADDDGDDHDHDDDHYNILWTRLLKVERHVFVDALVPALYMFI